MMDKINSAIHRLFDRYRIVFWYDAKKELRAKSEALSLPGVEKIEIENNQYGIKHRILREEPDQKFLLYHEGPEPDYLDNWLLDVQLAQGEFRADQVSLWLSELGLGPEFWPVVQDHTEFYRAASRRTALQAKLKPAEDTESMIRMKMLAVCVNASTEPRLADILEMLLDELAQERDERYRLIQRANLEGFLWGRVGRVFGYDSDTPGGRDFCIALFQSVYALGVGETAPLTAESQVFLNRWKDSLRHHAAFEVLSDQCASDLNIEADLYKRNLDTLKDLDVFQLIDQKILDDLVSRVAERTISVGDCANLVWRRRNSHWYSRYEHVYQAIEQAAQFMAALNQVKLEINSLQDGIQKYCETWYQLDSGYRKFIFHARISKQVSLLQPLMEKIENLYTNNFLLRVNDRWQEVLDPAQTWEIPPVIPQREFYERFVMDFILHQRKVVLIISDALRYEAGQELLERVRSEDRYQAELEPILSVLPSYTQLGMAALLPHKSLEIRENGVVYADGQSTAGTDNRAKILAQAISEGAAALRCDDLLAMTRDESRALVRDHRVIYVYHNRIDAVGDKRDTEERTCEAVEQALDELIDIIKKLAAANVTNMLVTADHGFIYQHRPIDESEFAGVDVAGDEILYRDRRFVIGRGLQPNASVKAFSAADLGLTGDLEFMIPKSINRLRLKGAGSRYVHGGASLQEVIVPLLRINKKRTSDVGKVEVEILRSSSSIITTGQLAVAFYQDQPVTSKTQARELRAGIYTQAGVLISDTHDLIFDLTSENPREREANLRFVFSSKADQANDQEVILKLEEQVAGTSHYREYKSVRYILRRSFTSDFDF
ncbi:MAG: BREX-1 system phosphatase PglZ type A [Chloroflexota bacterium]